LLAALIGCAHPVRPLPAEPTLVHVVEDTGTVTRKASLTEVQALLDLLRDRAAKAGWAGDRAAVRDVALAGSQREFDEIMKGALVMVVAISRDAGELPPQISIDGPSGNVPLFPVAVLPPALTRQLQVDGRFGNNLWAGVFFAPLIKRIKGTPIADFGPKQRSFVLERNFPPIDAWTDSGAKDVSVSPDAVEEMCRREYPDFTIDPEFRQAMNAVSGK
jgi:hypothetical protein